MTHLRVTIGGIAIFIWSWGKGKHFGINAMYLLL